MLYRDVGWLRSASPYGSSMTMSQSTVRLPTQHRDGQPARRHRRSVGGDASHAPRGEVQGNVFRLDHLMAQEREVRLRRDEASEHGAERGRP